MTDAKFSDLDRKVHSKDECYKVTIHNYAETLELVFDMAMDQKRETIENCIKLAVQNKCVWVRPPWMKAKKVIA